MAVTMEVMSRSLWSNLCRRQAVASCFIGIFSVIPPVRSASPSRSDPYLRASYDPCNLQEVFEITL